MRAAYTKLLTAILMMLIGCNVLAQESNWVVRGVASYAATANDKSPVISMQPPPLGQESISQSVSAGPGFGFAVE